MQLSERAVEQYKAGKVTLDQLALRMNISKGKVANLLRAAGVDVPKARTGFAHKVTELPAELIEAYRAERTTVAGIARKTQHDPGVVNRLLREAGCEIRPAGKTGGKRTPWGSNYQRDVKLPPGAVNRYNVGAVTLAELAEEMGCSVDDARRELNKVALYRPGPARRWPKLPEDARAMYLGGATLEAVMEHLGCSKDTLRRLLTEAGIPLRTDSEARKLRWETTGLRRQADPTKPAQVPPGLDADDAGLQPDQLVEPD